jgi:hypothetical protein
MAENEATSPVPSTDQVDILRVAFDESVRKLDAVHGAAESVRSRAGTVLAAATAIGGFVGSLALDRSPTGWQWAAITAGALAYLASLALSLHVLLPQRSAWQVGQNTAKLAKASGSTPAWFVYGRLATRYQESFEDSERRIREMRSKVLWAVVLMVVELVSFACVLAATATRDPEPVAPGPMTEPTTVVPSTTAPPTTVPPLATKLTSTSSTSP